MPKTDGHIAYLFYRIGTQTTDYEKPKIVIHEAEIVPSQRC